MSDHLKPQSPELIAALQNHGLKTDTPSQLSDAFRLGWNAAIIGNATPAPSDKIAEAARVLVDATPNPVFDMLKPVLMGEFKERHHYIDEHDDEVSYETPITWTTTKEIIAAALRALAGQGETP